MGRKAKEFNKEDVRKFYLEDKMLPSEIANAIGVSLPIIMTFLKKENIYYDGRKARSEETSLITKGEKGTVGSNETIGNTEAIGEMGIKETAEEETEIIKESKYFNPKETKIKDFIASNNGERPECPDCHDNKDVFFFEGNYSGQKTTGFHCMECDKYFGLVNMKI